MAVNGRLRLITENMLCIQKGLNMSRAMKHLYGLRRKPILIPVETLKLVLCLKIGDE